MYRAIQIFTSILIAASPFAGADLPAFDVASVKPNRSVSRASSTSRSGGRVALDNVSLHEAIEVAYGIPPGRRMNFQGLRGSPRRSSTSWRRVHPNRRAIGFGKCCKRCWRSGSACGCIAKIER